MVLLVASVALGLLGPLVFVACARLTVSLLSMVFRFAFRIWLRFVVRVGVVGLRASRVRLSLCRVAFFLKTHHAVAAFGGNIGLYVLGYIIQLLLHHIR